MPKNISIKRLFVVQIEHEQGTNAYPATTEELAWAVLYAWVKRYWDNRLWSDTKKDEIGEIPEDQDYAIKLYFDATDGESFEVEQHIVIDSPEALVEAM